MQLGEIVYRETGNLGTAYPPFASTTLDDGITDNRWISAHCRGGKMLSRIECAGRLTRQFPRAARGKD